MDEDVPLPDRGWDHEDYRLTDAAIEACLTPLPQRDLDDIRFAQDQVRLMEPRQA